MFFIHKLTPPLVSLTVQPFFKCHLLNLIASFPVEIVGAIAVTFHPRKITFIAIEHKTLSVAQLLFEAEHSRYVMSANDSLIPPAIYTISVIHTKSFICSIKPLISSLCLLYGILFRTHLKAIICSLLGFQAAGFCLNLQSSLQPSQSTFLSSSV